MKRQYHVSHILVSHDYEAQDLLRKLQEGKTFEELAAKFSKCPSSKKGGDLGPLTYGKADEDFEDAALALKVGETSKKPVRTKFGYHILMRHA